MRYHSRQGGGGWGGGGGETNTCISHDFVHRIGTFPNCAQCNETCYENWYHLIAVERDNVTKLSQEVTNVLQTFNGTSVENINQTLAELNRKLAESEKIFNGARFDTDTKTAQYNKVRIRVSLESFQLCFSIHMP